MSSQRLCKRCNYVLSDMDPHTICKACRQPDPQMFFCSEGNCEACNFIKENKPLDAFLRQHELANLQKKLQQFASHHSNSDRAPYSNNSLEIFSNKSIGNSSNAGVDYEKVTTYNSDILKNVVKSTMKLGNFPPNVSNKLGNFPPNVSSSNKNDNLKELEKRLFDRVMSSVMNSLSDKKKSQPEEVNNASQKPIQTTPSATISSTCIELNKDECELNIMLLSFLEECFPDSFSRVSKGSSENGKSEIVVKISSKACDVLAKGTVLSSPSQASKLRNELKMDSGLFHWPFKLNASDILYSSLSRLPNMKLHPKIRHMHSLLFGKLKPSLPSNLLSDNFSLPELSVELKNEFFFAREQLQRLLLIFSVMDYYCGEKIVQENSSLLAFFEIVLNYIKCCMERQANFVGLLIQELRRDLLRDADCKIPDAIPKLIMGSIHQSQFFGPYVKELQDIVANNDSSYCITSKSEAASVNLFMLPSVFKEGDSVENFLINLRVYFESNSIHDEDKVLILENLLPKEIIDRLNKFVKPNKIKEISFEELSSMLKRFDCNNSSDILLDRLTFTKKCQSKDQSIQEFADQLENLLPKCMYGASAREMLRDQFVFGLANKMTQKFLLEKFNWCFEECIQYAEDEEEKNVSDKSSCSEEDSKLVLPEVKAKTVDPKLSNKRKQEENKEVEPVVKKQKVQEMKDIYFYDYSNPKIKSVNVKTLQQWNDLFGFEVKHTYEVYCPWTGQVLRS